MLRDTAIGGCTGIALQLSIESPSEEQHIARLVRTAERLCFLEQTVVNPVPVELSVVHNGSQIEFPAGVGGGN